MSIEAMSWVIKLDMSRSSEKFIMVCLANYADEHGICYPSVMRLMRDTGQDRKTVLLNLKRLCDGGMLRDTGQRVGRTASVVVYELVGMPSNSKVHYVYKVSNLHTGEFYIGKRSFNGDPELDIYRGSGRWVVDMQARKISLHREVLEVFDSDVEARACEMRWFKKVGIDPLCKNEGTPYLLSKNVRCTHQEESNGKNGTASSGTVFPSSSPVFPGSSPVFPSKQSQKRDTEPFKEPPVEQKEKVARGTRLPKDWVFPKEYAAWARTEFPAWNDAYLKKVATMFYNHWTAKSTDAAKLDWFATWQNWCYKEPAVPKELQGTAGAAAISGDWWKSSVAITEKGKSLNPPILQQEHEQFPHFRDRVYVAAGPGPWESLLPATRSHEPPSAVTQKGNAQQFLKEVNSK